MSESTESSPPPQLEGGAYEVIRNRLLTWGDDLRARLGRLNADRQAVFGAVEPALLATERVTTLHNCVPRDMVPIGGNRFLFGYNVRLGLKSQTALSDVFAVYRYDPEDHSFHAEDLANALGAADFERDFHDLYKYYRESTFAKFRVIGPHLFMAFRVGKDITDIKTFKWALTADRIEYLGNRSDHEYVFPPQQEFDWIRAHRDMQRHGEHPHISIEDRIFVETVGGDLTIKVEDNTESGEGIYAEAVDEADQTLDDAEVFYASIGSLILLKILPFREKDYRYLVYNEKTREVFSVPAIRDSCVLLPDDHGLIFANGYLLQSGGVKRFGSGLADMRFERRISSPNGEDTLFVFYNRRSGDYILLSYNLILQSVETPILCNGFSLFPDGELLYFKTEEQPQKHHVVQVWRTPYADADSALQGDTSSYLYKVGNADLVRGMAECQEVLNLLAKDDAYGDLYLDLVRKTGDITDSYFWIGHETAHHLSEPLQEINQTAQAAIAEFDKVQRMRRNATAETNRVARIVEEVGRKAVRTRPDDILGFVHLLGELRQTRGDLVTTGEVRYVDPAVIEGFEAQVMEATDKVSRHCVDFLQTDAALDPYRAQVETEEARIAGVTKVVEANEIEGALGRAGEELDMLIEIVSNLTIEDATQTTRIIDDVSTIYARLNQVSAALKRRKQSLVAREGEAQFHARLKLLNQAVVNYLDLCRTPEACDDYLTKIMVQLEELEGEFSELDEYIEQLAEKRDEIYNAFETRKQTLTEARSRRAGTLFKSAARILTGIRHRVAQFETLSEINGYLSADVMVEKVRAIIGDLRELGDPVKADDLQTQLASIRDEAVRQLKDRQELFVEGADLIQFGGHRFSVNHQELELTLVPHEDGLSFHLAGTKFFEPARDPALEAAVELWNQALVSESRDIYRAEYLAYRFIEETAPQDGEVTAEAMQAFMAPRYDEGYTKGVHDHDAALIVSRILTLRPQLGLLRYGTRARAFGLRFWEVWPEAEAKAILEARLLAGGGMRRTFKQDDLDEGICALLRQGMSGLAGADEVLVREAAEYLFHELSHPSAITVAAEAATLIKHFESELGAKRARKRFEEALAGLEGNPEARHEVVLDWVRGFLATGHEAEAEAEYAEEAAVHLFRGGFEPGEVKHVNPAVDLEGLRGAHGVVDEGGVYPFHYNRFMDRLRRYQDGVVPVHRAYVARKRELVETRRRDMRLDQFKPEVMSGFVRNQLLDEVYLPLLGANLAKQIGAAGSETRADRMGLLLLISPPGYGKTTLMEYVANRLGITFMKINGPAIGHAVTSLDPAEAPNASARAEVNKLNLALEMGDNVMIYLDDIQHCHPEFLQKFISLCDAQRKMEGVWNGQARTYDLRGKKVAVVMAGNPYTGSGGKFQVPDMLANRADTYNLGDISGAHARAFEASYIENAVTSNPVLARLGSRGQGDVRALMKIAESGTQEGVDFEGSYSVEEIGELVSVMKKLFRVRDTILRVNREYIRSAAQQDDYRTEPPFLLQGSYRNMNRIAERLLPVMTDEEVDVIILAHYENEAQNLTTGAEANLLKFHELEGWLGEEQTQRWSAIVDTFQRNAFLGGSGQGDPVDRVVAQMALVEDGLQAIREALTGGSGPGSAATEALEEIGRLLREWRDAPLKVEVTGGDVDVAPSD